MPDCTVVDVITKAMSALGDPQGEITAEIVEDFRTTYAELYQAAQIVAAPEIIRKVYFTVPANTGIVIPQSLGVTDFSEPRKLWERGSVNSVAVVGCTDTTPVVVTFAIANAIANQSQIELSGIQGVPTYINRDWYVTVTSPTTATLNGSVAYGTGNGTGGSAAMSQDTFTEMTEGATANIMANAPSLIFRFWTWESGNIYLPAVAEARQLLIEYLAGAQAPASGNIGLFAGRELNFLAYGTAARFAPKRGIQQGPQLAMDAYGESGMADGSGGMLWTLLAPIYLQQQQTVRRSPLFRRRRVQAWG